jgi:hypothetical protein
MVFAVVRFVAVGLVKSPYLVFRMIIGITAEHNTRKPTGKHTHPSLYLVSRLRSLWGKVHPSAACGFSERSSPICRLKPLGLLTADNHFILTEFLFQAVAQTRPPTAIDSLSHDLDYRYVIMFP